MFIAYLENITVVHQAVSSYIWLASYIAYCFSTCVSTAQNNIENTGSFNPTQAHSTRVADTFYSI